MHSKRQHTVPHSQRKGIAMMCVVVSGDVGYFVLVVSYGAGVPTEFEQNEDKFSHVQFAVFDGRTTMHGILIQNELLHFNDSNEIRKNVNPFEE